MKLSAIAHTIFVTLSLSGVAIAPGCIECPWRDCRQMSTYERFKTGWKSSGPCGAHLGGGTYCQQERAKKYYQCMDCKRWASLNAQPRGDTPPHLRNCPHPNKAPLDPASSPLCQAEEQASEPSTSQTQAPVYHNFLGLEEASQSAQPGAPVYHNFLGLPNHDS